MYVGNNITALKSQAWIANAIVVLMKEKLYSEISVKDICIKADLSRQTFYNVFETKDEVLRFILQNEYQKQFAQFTDNKSILVTDIVQAFSIVLKKEEEILSLMIKNNLEHIITSEISKCVSLFAERFVKEENKNHILPYSIALVSGAIAELLVYWFKQEKPISMKEIETILTDFLSGNLYEL